MPSAPIDWNNLSNEQQYQAADYIFDKRLRRWIRFGLLTFIGVILAVFVFTGIVGPQFNLYRKNTEKQAVIAEQKAKSKAAEYAARSTVTQARAKADAEVERAKGLSESQKIISSTLSDDYLQYLYINALADGNGQIIYVPTEAGLPILEAGRSVADGASNAAGN